MNCGIDAQVRRTRFFLRLRKKQHLQGKPKTDINIKPLALPAEI